MRVILDKRALFGLVWHLYAFSLSAVLALPTELLYNLTVPTNHPSVIYWPQESWTSITPSHYEGVPTYLLHCMRCMLEQGARYRLASPNVQERKSEDMQAMRTDWNRGRRTSTSLLRSQQLRTESSCSDFVEQDASSGANYPPMTLRFRFIGAGIYIFGLSASLSPKSRGTPLTTPKPCISFAIDGQQPLRLAITDSALSEVVSCSMNEPIFSHFGLSEDLEHELEVTISPSSIFLLSHIVYTTKRSTIAKAHKLEYPQLQPLPNDLRSKNTPLSDCARTRPEPDSPWHQMTLKPRTEETSPAPTPSSNKHNTTTFAVAVGTVVGVFTIVSLAVALSIIRRRHLARLRDTDTSTNATSSDEGQVSRVRARRISSSSTSSSIPSTSSTSALHTDASEDMPHPIHGQRRHMTQIEGTRSFVPRFFPGMTVLPQQVHDVSFLSPPATVDNLEVQGQVPEQDPPSYDDSMALPPSASLTGPVSAVSSSMHQVTGRQMRADDDILNARRTTAGRVHNRGGDSSGHDSSATDLDGRRSLYASYADIPPPMPPPPGTPVPLHPPSPQPLTHSFPNITSPHTTFSTSMPRSHSSSSENGYSHTRDRQSGTPSPLPSVSLPSTLPLLPSNPTGGSPDDVSVDWTNPQRNNEEFHGSISPAEPQHPPGLDTT